MSAVGQTGGASSGTGSSAGASGPAVFVGADNAAQQEEVERTAREVGATAAFCWDAEEAQALLSEPDQQVPRCLVVDDRTPGVEGFVAWMRGEARLFPVPVVVQARGATDDCYLGAHALGADDAVVAGDHDGIARRLRNLAAFDPLARPPLTQGRAVVAHSNELRRRVLGRILRQAGFDVSFALDAEDLVRVARGGAEAPALVVAEAGLPAGGPLDAVRSLRGQEGFDRLCVIVIAPGDRVAGLREESAALGAAAVAYETAPPDNLLFLANELLRPDVQNVRASTRVLYGTICGFRRGGTLEPVFGLTYNISREGLYIRTLDPPAPGTPIWLELRPPHSDGVVHLRGKSVWARGLRSPGGAAPAGFGVRISADHGPPEDRQAYEAGYDLLRAALASN